MSGVLYLELSSFVSQAHEKGSLIMALSRLSAEKSEWVVITYKVLVFELIVEFKLQKVVPLEEKVDVHIIVNEHHCLDLRSEWHWFLFIQLNP